MLFPGIGACLKNQARSRRGVPVRRLRMRPPGRGLEQFHLLGHQQRAELRGKAFDEILVFVHCGPVRPAVRVVLEFPQMDKLIDRAVARKRDGPQPK